MSTPAGGDQIPQLPKIPEEKLKLIIPVHAQAVMWMAVVANVQLALRHPKNVGPSRDVVREFGRTMISKLQDEGVIDEDLAREAFMDFFV